MRAKDRATARRQLDKRLDVLRSANIGAQLPPRRWIKAIREALGMTTKQLATRIGVGQSRIVAIEKAEVSGAITLNSLERAAHALDCEFVYAIIPRTSLESMVENRASALAKNRIKAARHTMTLEDQRLDEDDEREQVKELTRRFSEQSGSALWEDA
ncbi:MAG: mobile mystery protein A [Halioglobus sp.]